MYPQSHQYYGMIQDLYLDTYYIVNTQHGSDDVQKWYFREFDETANRVLWVSDVKRAKEFHSKDEALTVGTALNRKFVVEEVEDWIF